MNSNLKKGAVPIILATIIWGTVGINLRLLTDQGLEPFTINFINMLIASVFIFSLAQYTGNKISFKLKKNLMRHLILQGIFFGCTVILLFYSFLYTSIAEATFLQKTMPLWVVVLSFFILKEIITVRKILSLIIGLIGMFLLFIFNTTRISFTGDILAILSAFTFAGLVLNGRRLREVSEFTSTFFQLAVACILMIPFMIIRFSHNSVDNILLTIFLFFFLAIVNTGITQRLFLKGLRYIEASKASILTFIEPISATVFAFFFFGERLNLYSVFGILLIMSSVVILFLPSKKRNI